MALFVRDVMTKDPVWVFPGATAEHCVALMMKHHIRHLPVIDHAHQVVGVISQRDLIARGLIGTRNERVQHEPDSTHAGEIMTRTFHVVHAGDRAVKAAAMIRNNGYSGLPVIEGGRLVGVITATDFVSLVVDHADLFDGAEPDPWSG